MKKLLCGCLILIMTLSVFCGCGVKNNDSNKTENSTDNKNDGEIITNTVSEVITKYPQVSAGVYDMSELFKFESGGIKIPSIDFENNIIVQLKMGGEFTMYPFDFEGQMVYTDNAVVHKTTRENPHVYGTDSGLVYEKIENEDADGYRRYIYSYNNGKIELKESEIFMLNNIERYSYFKGIYSRIRYYNSDCIPYLARENGSEFLKKCDLVTGKDEVIADIEKNEIGWISCLAHGKDGYVFAGNGWKNGKASGEQTKGAYGFIDNQGNIKDVVFDYENSAVAFNGGVMVMKTRNTDYDIVIDEITIIRADGPEYKRLSIDDEAQLNGTKRISANGKYLVIGYYDEANNKSVFNVYDTALDKCIYSNELVYKDGASSSGGRISVTEKYRGFTYSFWVDDEIKTYFYTF